MRRDSVGRSSRKRDQSTIAVVVLSPLRRWLTAIVVFCAFIVSGPHSAEAGLTEAPRLAAIYDSILQARFGQARGQIDRACPPAPAEACQLLSTVTLWWE